MHVCWCVCVGGCFVSLSQLALESDGNATEEGTVCRVEQCGSGLRLSSPGLPCPAPGWAHVVCALYIPEVQFANVLTMEPIVLQYVPHDRFNKVSGPYCALTPAPP